MYTSRQTHPWADTLPQVDTTQDGDCSGRYASYWNAFSLSLQFLYVLSPYMYPYQFMEDLIILIKATETCYLLKE